MSNKIIVPQHMALVIALALVVCLQYGASIPLHKFAPRTNPSSLEIKDILRTARTTVGVALNNYIEGRMRCTSVEECRTYSTSLRLTNLPLAVLELPEVNNENWRVVFEENLNGLQDFNYFLQNIFASIIQEPYLAETAATDMLTDTTHLFQQLMAKLQIYVRERHCQELSIIPLSSYPPCDVCKNKVLPSRHLEVVRDYQFLMQLHEYLGEFMGFFNRFLMSIPVSNSCISADETD